MKRRGKGEHPAGGDRSSGFSLIEILAAAVIFVLTMAGVLSSYIRCMELSEFSRMASQALSSIKSRVEAIKNTEFDQIAAQYHNVTFTLAGMNGIGVSYVDSTNPDLLKITIAFCWRQKNGRIFGEDIDLDGRLDAGEDKNADNMIDSPVSVVTFIFDA